MLFKMPALLVIASLAMQAHSQDSPRPIDLTLKATALQTALVQLSKQAGVQLQCSSDLADEPIILSLHKVPLQQVMDKIADVCAGEWVKRDKVLELRGDDDEAQKRHQEVIQLRVAEMQKSLTQFIKDTQANETYPDGEAKKMAANIQLLNTVPNAQVELEPKNGPGYRLLAQAIQHADLSKVAELEEDQQIVFAWHPTAFQEPLPNVGSSIEDAIDAANRIANAVDDLAKTQPKDIADNMRNTQGAVPITTQPIQVLLRFEYKFPLLYEAYINVFDKQGHPILSGATTLGRDLGQEEPDLDPQETNLLKNLDHQDVVFSESTIRLARYEGRDWHEPAKEPLPSDLRDAALTPSTIDPLSYVTSELVFNIAEKNNLNAVFLPTDACELREVANNSRYGASTVMLDWLKEMKITESGGWLLGEPIDPIKAAKKRMPRQALEDFAQAIDGHHAILFNDLIEFGHAVRPDASINLAYHPIFDLLDHIIIPLYNNDSSRYLWSLAATFNEDQYKQARSGGVKIPCRQLLPEQKDLLVQWLTKYQHGFGWVEKKEHFWDPLDEGEATQALGDGLDDASLEAVVQDVPTYAIAAGDAFGNPTDIVGVAQIVDMASDKTRKSDFDPNRIRVSSKTTFSVKLLKPNRFGTLWTKGEIEYRDPVEAKIVTLQQLLDSLSPEDRATYEKERAELDQVRRIIQQAYQNSGGTPPPPPAS